MVGTSPLPSTIIQYIGADSCQDVGWSGVHSTGPHADNRLSLCESPDTCEPLASEWGGKDGQESFDASPPPPLPASQVLLSCNCRTCREISNNTVQGSSLCSTSVMSYCMTPTPVLTKRSVTQSSRPPGAWTGAGGTFVPCPWSGA